MRAVKSRGGLTRGRGMSEAVRLLWIYSGYKCAEVHEAMTDLTSITHNTSNQHLELRSSRKERDFKDLIQMIGWLCMYNPFSLSDPNLQSLHSGLSSIQGTVEIVGAEIQRKMNNRNFNELSLKKSDCVVTLIICKKALSVTKRLFI